MERIERMDCYNFGCDESLNRMEGVDFYNCDCNENYTFIRMEGCKN